MKHFPVLHFRGAFECFKSGNRSNTSKQIKENVGFLPHPFTLTSQNLSRWKEYKFVFGEEGVRSKGTY